MPTVSALIAAVIVTGVGLVVLWSNPKRLVNRLVFTCSLHIATWLILLQMAVVSSEGLVWVRFATSVSALIPLHFWFVKESIIGGFSTRSPAFWGKVVFGCAGVLLLAFIPFTRYFIPLESTSSNRLVGPGYYIYIVGVLGMYVIVLLDSLRGLGSLSGGKKLALQVWLWGGCAAAATILLLMLISVLTGVQIRLQPFVVMIYYAGTALAITTHRVFDARQLLLIGAGKLLLGGIVAGVSYCAWRVLRLSVSTDVAFVVVILLAIWLAAWVGRGLDRILQFFPEATAARQAAFSAAQRESKVENLETAFRSVLKGWGQSETALMLSGTKGDFSGGGVELANDGPVLRAMRNLRWATPERLVRERMSDDREALRQFMERNDLGVVAIQEGLALRLLVGVGVSASRRPYTYPQVTQLLELASIMESALERAHFSQKVQHTEQLATVGLLGASLAHEIRNPLVSIKTFVQLLPTHHQDPRFREKFFKLIGDEVTRIDQLTEQLLDLASPRTYEAKLVELHPLLRSSLDLVAAKASHRNVRFLTEFEASPDAAFTDASAAKQVMLNLCFNAIQAVEAHAGEERWVKIATRNTPGGIEMAVADSGPGIAPEIRPKLFQPFQTTKSSGFGLGLAICSDILSNLHASISVDPPEPGHGATFRVTFPCQPLSS